MKTNISELMNIIADEEKKFVNITSYIDNRETRHGRSWMPNKWKRPAR